MRYLVLGNGFDLAHGLKTRYTDFLMYVIERDKALYSNYVQNNSNVDIEYIETNNSDEYISEKIKNNIWLNYFVVLYRDKLIRGENWIDFELEISYIIENFDRKAKSKLEYIYELKELNNDDDKKMLYFYNLYGILHASKDVHNVKKQTYQELIKNLSNDLDNLILAFEYYLQNEVEDKDVLFYSPDIKALGEINGILNFNYTTTYKRVYQDLSNTLVHYIHGKVANENGNNMVLGVNEYWEGSEADKHTDFNIFKKFVQRVMKDTGTDYRKWIYEATENGKSYENKRAVTSYKDLGLSEVYIFGHSLDCTDRDLLMELFENDNIVVNIYYKDKVHQADLIAAVVKMISEEKFIKQYQQYPQRIKFIHQHDMIKVEETQ